jgi:hypothetical protein
MRRESAFTLEAPEVVAPMGDTKGLPQKDCTHIQLVRHNDFISGETMDAPVKALNTEKAKALQAALAQIEKQFGKGSIMRLGEGEVIEDIQVVSTGSLGLDIALGVGGLPRGRVVEIYGPESSGKTTLTLQVIAEMQSSAAPPPSSTPNTRWTSSTRRSSASTCKTC